MSKIIDPITGQPVSSELALKEATEDLKAKVLDFPQPDPEMPAWHGDIAPSGRINIGGHWFEIFGIDPARPNDLILTYKRPSNKAIKRMLQNQKKEKTKNGN